MAGRAVKCSLWINGVDIVLAESAEAATAFVMSARGVDARSARAEGWHEIDSPTIIPLERGGQLLEKTAAEWVAELSQGYLAQIA